MKAPKNNPANFYLAPLRAVSSFIEIGNTILEGNKKIVENVLNVIPQKQVKKKTIKTEKMKTPIKIIKKPIDKKVNKKVIQKKDERKSSVRKNTNSPKAKGILKKKVVNSPKTNIAKKKELSPAVTKAKSILKKKAESSSIAKTKNVLKKKGTGAAINKLKTIPKKKIIGSGKVSLKNATDKKLKTSAKKSIIQGIKKEIPEVKMHGEDLHFIHEKGESIPLTKFEVHNAENIFQHREEVALHQENQRVRDARPSEKIFKSFNRRRG